VSDQDVVEAPFPTWRLVPSQFPPIGTFDTVATAADLQAVMELEGWTNDRLVSERLARLPQSEWVFSVPNASVVMAAFLHAAPGGNRFSGPHLGAWYAAASIRTAVAEVAHHLRRELIARGKAEERRTFRSYSARLTGNNFIDLRNQKTSRPDLYDKANYTTSQAFGEDIRGTGRAGIVYDSLRHRDGTNIVAYRPRQIIEVAQTDHYDVIVPLRGRIVARRLIVTNGGSR
jgi:hypothetical protein